MRTQLIVAVALLISADVARAQQWPASAENASASSGPAQLTREREVSLTGGMPVANTLTPVPAGPLVPVAETAPYYGGDAGFVTSGGGVGDRDYLWWVSGGYLIGWIPNMRLPTPLLTTGSVDDPAPGALRQPGTSVLFGNSIDFDPYQGFQAAVGIFCDEGRVCSFDAAGFYFFESSTSFNVASDANGSPVIARPIYNVLSEQEGAFLNARPGEASGSGTVEATSRMWGFETNARTHIGSDRLRGEALVGFRYLRFEEDLSIRDTLVPLRDEVFTFAGPFNFVNPPNFIMDRDDFQTQNTFYGGQIGGVLVWEDWWYFLRLSGKVAFGLTEQRASIGGSSTLVTPAGTQTVEGGILATATNIGSHRRTVFGIVPEWGITGGVFVTNWMRVSAGYSIMFWNRVIRPGDAIDRGVNPSFVPTANDFGFTQTPARPEFRFNDSSFWVQAVNAGVEFVY